MSKSKVTLAKIIEAVNSRPTTVDLDLALIEFLELSNSEQKSLLFKELCNISSQMNFLMSRF